MEPLFEDRHVGFKIKLYPTKSQIHEFRRWFGMVRYVYNKGIDVYEDYHDNAKTNDNVEYKHLSLYAINNLFTNMKNNQDDMMWLKDFGSKSITIVLQDLIDGYKKYFDHTVDGPPKYKSKKHAGQSFPVRKDCLSILGNYVYLPSFAQPIFAKSVPKELQGFGDKKCTKRMKKYRGYNYLEYCNPRVTYNGCDYYLSFTLKRSQTVDYNCTAKFVKNKEWAEQEYSDVIGFDLGNKLNNWLVGSNGMVLSRRNQSKLEHQKKGYQKALARKQRAAKNKCTKNKRIERTNQYKKSKKEIKMLEKLNKLEKKDTNQRMHDVHNFINSVIATKPKAIVLETFKTKEIMSKNISSQVNHDLMKSIPNTITRIFRYKSKSNGISLILAPPEYKSTQICSQCGHEQKMGRKRIYKCKCCGAIIDRDFNAALNLKNYGEHVLNDDNDIIS